MIGGARHHIRRQDAQRPAVFKKCFRVAVGVLLQRNSQGLGVLYYPVIDVGDVHDGEHLIAAIPQIAAQEVLEDEGPEIPYVRVVIYRGPAGVEAHQHAFCRYKILLRIGEGVIKA